MRIGILEHRNGTLPRQVLDLPNPSGFTPEHLLGFLASFWRETKDPEGVKQDSPGREPWVQGPDCGKP